MENFILSIGQSIVTLGLTWIVGQRIVVYWEARKKQREIDLATSGQFQQLYGETKQLNKLYRTYAKNPNGREYPNDISWHFVQLASDVESKVEALIVKLATERYLAPVDVEALGLFRQSIQQVRSDIRDHKERTFIGQEPGYTIFNELACDVAHIIANGKFCDELTKSDARTNLRSIAQFGSKALEARATEHIKLSKAEWAEVVVAEGQATA